MRDMLDQVKDNSVLGYQVMTNDHRVKKKTDLRHHQKVKWTGLGNEQHMAQGEGEGDHV